jgi:tetratricopeptide (TPR) repeat protein/TolB-like protein
MSSQEQLQRLAAGLTGRYRIEREIGQGGMATVYLAHDLRHDRPVALKVLKPEIASFVGVDRFLREIRITARLNHPHILPLLDSGEVSGDPAASPTLFYVMPLVEGESLRDRLNREKQLPLDTALEITRDVADALAFAHGFGVIHRDIKPENILLPGGRAVVTDFGIARAVTASDEQKLTETGLAIGTPGYMSPEQAAGESLLDARSDIFSLGCVLYEMIAGQPPFTGPTAQAVLARRLVEPPPPLRPMRETVSQDLERAVFRSLARAPADRYSTAAEFAATLTRAPGEASRPVALPRSRRWPWVAAVFVLLLIAAAAIRFIPKRATSSVVPSASRIAVLPFTPSGTDTALARLGRDLVFTLSAELDGLGDIRVVDAHTILAQTSRGELSPAAVTDFARRFSAGSLVQGSLVRDGDGVRLDFAMVSVDSSGTPLARGAVRSAVDSVAALTDSVVHTLLKQIWVGENAPTPSLESALRTRSVSALRAFLEGEQQLARGEWEEAALSYARAREADPGFLLAGARMIFALNWSLQVPPDTVVAELLAQRGELPEADRLTTEAILRWAQDSAAQSLERARELTEKYPSSWFGWLIYGDLLMHDGPLQGHYRSEALAAFDQALERNSDLVPVHEHLMLLAIQARDTARAGQTLAELERLDAGPTMSEDGYGNRLLQFRFLLSLMRGDSSVVLRLTDSIARDPTLREGVGGTYYDALLYGFLQAQIRVSEQMLQMDGDRRRGAFNLLAASWLGRGAWDSSLALMDQLAASGLDPQAPLRSYGYAVLGHFLGAIPEAAVTDRRGAAATVAVDSSQRAELEWLDGIVGFTRRDRAAVGQARSALRGMGTRESLALDRSIAAFERALSGDSVGAGRDLAALEWEQSRSNASGFAAHPQTIAVDRIAAARWLAAEGDADQAARLLAFADGAYLLHPSRLINASLYGLVARQRGMVEEQRGQAEPAREYYRQFLRWYDRPTPLHLGMVEEVKGRASQR